MEGIGRGLEWLLLLVPLGIIGTIGFASWVAYDHIGTQTIESKTRIVPDYRLEATGKQVDTIYIYKFK